MNWFDLRPGDELMEKPGSAGRHFLVLSRKDNMLILFVFHLNQVIENDLLEIHEADYDKLTKFYTVVRHA